MKNTWPELVGKTVDQAKALLAEVRPPCCCGRRCFGHPRCPTTSWPLRSSHICHLWSCARHTGQHALSSGNDNNTAVVPQEAPGYNVQVIPFGYFATEDYRTDRIRIWLGQDELVERPPRIG
jgi:hypothetical protein